MRRICFDMDGTIADFYNVNNWLDCLMNEDATPYKIAKPLVNMNVLARRLNKLQKRGYEIGIISWLSKSGTEPFNKEVTKVKREWLNKHLKSVKWDFIEIVNYGTDKNLVLKTENDILFDDEIGNRKAWRGKAYNVNDIINVLKEV